MAPFLFAVVALLALGMAAAAARKGPGRAVLPAGLTLSALALVINGIWFDANDGFANSDCVGQCIDSFDYHAPIYGAQVGGILFVCFLVIAFIRLVERGSDPNT